MTLLGRSILGALFLASPAVAEDLAEDAVLTWAEGREDGARVRMFVGEVDGRGVVYAEHYQGNRLVMIVPYTRVFVDNDGETSVRALKNLAMVAPNADGFAFEADEVTVRLSCTALLYANATINCTRGSPRPSGSASCARYFQSRDERSNCNVIQAHYASPPIPHDDLAATCAASFRAENRRSLCMSAGYNTAAPLFREALAACTAAYRTQDERSFCVTFTLQTTEKQMIPPELVRQCAKTETGDKAITDCAFFTHTGAKQAHPEERGLEPDAVPTAPVTQNAVPAKKRLEGGRIEVAVGTSRDLTLRATGGMVGSEPVLWVDGHRNEKHEWMQPVDRIVIGKQVRALREVSSLAKVKLGGDLLTFRAVLGGKRLDCRVDAGRMFARCR